MSTQVVEALGALASTTYPASVVVVNVSGLAGVGIQLSGTFDGTVLFEGSVDGRTFGALTATPIGTSTSVTSAIAAGVWKADCAALKAVQCRMSVFNSGAAVVSILAQTGSIAGGGGSGGGGGGDASAANQVLQTTAINLINAQRLDYDSGAGTATQVIVGLSLPASGGPVGVSGSNPLPVIGPTLTAGAPTFATVGTSEAEALAAGATRKMVELVNTSANFISLSFGANAAVLNSGWTLTPYGTRVIDNPSLAALAIRAIASGASSNLAIQPYT